MRELKYASLRYCPHLGHNVVMEGRFLGDGGFKLECLNKGDCGYREAGCRNLLLKQTAERSETRSIEVG